MIFIKDYSMSMNITLDMTKTAVAALEEKKGEDIRIIDIRDISPIADYFILANGGNRNQVQAMADEVEEQMQKMGHALKQVEGYSTANWILMDYSDIVVHIFDRESRSFYDLERIWRDGNHMDADELKAN